MRSSTPPSATSSGAALGYSDLSTSQRSRPALNADVFFMATQYVLSVKKTSVSGVAALKALEWSR